MADNTNDGAIVISNDNPEDSGDNPVIPKPYESLIEMEDIKPEEKSSPPSPKYEKIDNSNGSVQTPKPKPAETSVAVAAHQGKKEEEKSTITPWIFKGLTLILLIAVIAFGFLLHHENEKIEKNTIKVNKKHVQTEEVTKKEFDTLEKTLQANITTLKNENAKLTLKNKQLKADVEAVKTKSAGYEQKITSLRNTSKYLRTDLESDNKKLTDAVGKIKNTSVIEEANIAKINSTAEKVKMSAETNKAGIVTLEEANKVVNSTLTKLKRMSVQNGDKILNMEIAVDKVNNSTIANKELVNKMNGNITQLQTNVAKNKKSLASVEKIKSDVAIVMEKAKGNNDSVTQLNMYMKYQAEYKDQTKLGMTFEDVLRLTHRADKVTGDIKVFKDLETTYTTFISYNKTWGIDYKVVIDLTEKEDASTPQLEKIEDMYLEFTKSYSKWNITFKDVIGLTDRINFNDSKKIPVLINIESAYHDFKNMSYGKKWGMTFHDVIDLSSAADFRVVGNVPIIKEIESFYVDGFDDIWKNHNFKGLVTAARKRKIKSSVVAEKLSRIINFGQQNDKSLRFLPGSFGFEVDGSLGVSGFVAILHNDTIRNISAFGTIRDNAFANDAAAVLCKTGNYTSGSYDKGDYKTGDIKYRSTLEHTIYSLYCSDAKPTDISECIQLKWNDNGKQTWSHETEDVGVKCIF